MVVDLDFFAPGPVTLSRPELLKYLVLLEEAMVKWRKDNPKAPWNTYTWYSQWIREQVHDSEERLKFAGVLYSLPTTMAVLKDRKEIVELRITRAEKPGEISWDLAHECEKPCPHRAIS